MLKSHTMTTQTPHAVAAAIEETAQIGRAALPKTTWTPTPSMRLRSRQEGGRSSDADLSLPAAVRQPPDGPWLKADGKETRRMKKNEIQKKILRKTLGKSITKTEKKTATSQTKRRRKSDFVIPDESEKEVVLGAEVNLSSTSFLPT